MATMSPLLLLLIGCGEPEPPAPVGPEGRLVIEELYYAGSPPMGGTDHYFSDQFIELANNSPDRIEVGGLYVADVYGAAGVINPGMAPDAYTDRLILDSVWRIPGDPEDTILEPGESILIAHDGTNHTPFSTVDLSGADWEAYVDGGNDDDHPTVDNLEEVHFSGGYDWLITVFGPSVVVLESGADFSDFSGGPWPLQEGELDDVIDGIDTVMDGNSGDFKRLADSVDSGFMYVSDTYSGESLQRHRTGVEAIEGGWLQDTDDSSEDFEVLQTPEPRG